MPGLRGNATPFGKHPDRELQGGVGPGSSLPRRLLDTPTTTRSISMVTSPLQRLRQHGWVDAIPDTIDLPKVGSETARRVSIERTTTDEIAFASVALLEGAR